MVQESLCNKTQCSGRSTSVGSSNLGNCIVNATQSITAFIFREQHHVMAFSNNQQVLACDPVNLQTYVNIVTAIVFLITFRESGERQGQRACGGL